MLMCKICNLTVNSKSHLILHNASHGNKPGNGIISETTQSKSLLEESTTLANECDPFGDARVDNIDVDPDWLPTGAQSNGVRTSLDNDDDDEQPSVPEEPVPRKRGRWNTADPSSWARNRTKKLRNTGQAYTSKYGEFQARKPKAVNCKCAFNCHDVFTEEDRFEIFSEYWKLGSYERQKDFIISHSKSLLPQRRRTRKGGKERSNAKQFFLMKDNIQKRVCRAFFLKTLCISNGPLNTAYAKTRASGSFTSGDMRGKHPPANKTPSEETEKIKRHIEKFPVVDAHYVRKSSQKKYLDSKLSISKMYSLYKEECSEKNEKVPSITTYKRIFCKEYNYSFFKPRKDQCSLCIKYEAAREKEKNVLQNEYLEHKQREKDANTSKATDKARACIDPTFVTATFDLQSVLQIPSSDVSPMYYSRKLCAYNLTVYEGAPPNNAHCYTWHEVNGRRGSIEIGTCLFLFLTSLPQTVTEVSLFSDSCGGQNRNQNVVALLLYIVRTTNIAVIEQKFLESGHSMMECDSMHSAIEHQKKFVPVYTMHDWINIFRVARSARKRKNASPYNIKELRFNDFLDLSTLSSNILCNRTKDTEGRKVNWLKVKCFRFEKKNPGVLKYRYSHSGKYEEINVFRRGRPQHASVLQKSYKAPFPISEKNTKT